MAVFEDSRYIKTSAYFNKGELTFSLRQRPKFNEDAMTTYTWMLGDTIDGLSYRMYGNDSLWWAIMDANPQYQSEIDIQIGDILLIPDYEEVVEISG